MKKKPDRAAEFESYYQTLYGERWPSLRAALEAEKIDYETVAFPGCEPYALNRASAVCARTLGVEPGHAVLDLCAAPGGKTVILAAALNGRGRLISNDLSPERRRRLKKTIETVLPPAIASAVSVTGNDAALFGRRMPESFDRVLADVPCSSEGHLIRKPQLLTEWSPARIRSLCIRQFAILAAGLDALKTGGEMIYSTCAIVPDENDGVISKLKLKRPDTFEILPLREPGEPTRFGRLILPDTYPGMGPLFICHIRKTGNSRKEPR